MMTPTTREEWEALSADELAGYSDLQLKKALQEHFGLRSHVYFMPVAVKREFILNEAKRPAIQNDAEERQQSHQSAGAEHRGKKSVKELITERSEDRLYVFVGVGRPEGGFTDPFNDRNGKVAYVIRDEADGAEFPTQKQTCKVLDELGRLRDFDATVSIKKQKPAHRAGFATLGDVIAGGDPEVQEVQQELMPVEVASLAPNTDLAPIDDSPIPTDEAESVLDDILNSIPQ